MIDIHCHLLPGIDDGAKSWEITLEMCRMAAAGRRDPYCRDSACQLRISLRPRRSPCPARGAPVARSRHELFPGMRPSSLLRKYRGCACSTRNAMPSEIRATCWWNSPSTAPSTSRSTLFELQTAGLAAHPHPSGAQSDDFGQSRTCSMSLPTSGCLIQITANSLTGFWGKASTEDVRGDAAQKIWFTSLPAMLTASRAALRSFRRRAMQPPESSERGGARSWWTPIRRGAQSGREQ